MEKQPRRNSMDMSKKPAGIREAIFTGNKEKLSRAGKAGAKEKNRRAQEAKRAAEEREERLRKEAEAEEARLPDQLLAKAQEANEHIVSVDDSKEAGDAEDHA